MASAYVSISRGMDRENVVYTTMLLKSCEPRHTYLLVSGSSSRSKHEPFLTHKLPLQITLKGIGEFYFLVFQNRVSLCCLSYPGTHFVDLAGLELRDPPVSASWD